jgi:hypothetical protein
MLYKGQKGEHVSHKSLKRKDFLLTLGKGGAAMCACAAAAGMQAALAGQSTPTKPGDKSVERSAKRMEFADGWVRRFFDALDGTVDEASRQRLMIANGRSCFAAYAGPPKKTPDPDALEKFTAWIAEKGKERGYAIEGKVVSFEFVGSAETGQASPEGICLCPMAEAQKAGQLSPTYCLCSVGYVKEMHERMLGRSIEVDLADSVLRGGKRCKFRMMIA